MNDVENAEGPDRFMRSNYAGTRDEYDALTEERRLTYDPAPVYSHSAWDKLVDNMFEEVRHLAKAKGGEYSGDFDRLANFRRNGVDQDLPMESIWRVYAAKHWDAIGQYVKDLRTGKQRERMEPIDGRIKDLIVYLLLFQAMVDERAKD